MTNISLGNTSASIPTQSLGQMGPLANRAPDPPLTPAAPEPSVVLALSMPAASAQVYDNPRFEVFNKRVISGPSEDSLSKLVLTNQNKWLGMDPSNRLKGLGSGLLERFKTTQSDDDFNFNFNVIDFDPGTSVELGPDGYSQGAFGLGRITGDVALSSFSDRASKFQLKIKTRSGAEVNIQIRDGQDEARGLRSGLGVSVQTTGPLTDDERKSIAKLAEGFEAALQGIGANNPQINIAGLVNFDSAQLSSVNFSYKPRGNMITERSSSFDFYADDRKVRVALKSPPGLPAGNFSIESDRSQPGLQGNPAQRQASVQRYLAQFETAVLKGKGSKDLLQQFKDSFAQINSEAPPSAVSRPPAIGTAPLPDSVSALLTGLGDFQASINGDFNNSSSGNYATQAGNFDYRADQKTELRQGNAPGNGSITQTKNEKLAVRIISSNGDNRLDTSTGNYNVRLIEDSSQTKLLLDYVRGNLTQAKQVREQDESEKFTMYENFKVVEQSDKPRATTSVTDLLEKLNPA